MPIDVFRTIEPGMFVRIIDIWDDDCIQNSSGQMDHMLGGVFEVNKVIPSDDPKIRIQDPMHDRTWLFNRHMIDSIVYEEEECGLVSSEEFVDPIAFLFGGASL